VKSILKPVFFLIAAYLVLAYATAFGKDMKATSSAGTSVIKTLQGR
jgi:hypothetical protein